MTTTEIAPRPSTTVPPPLVGPVGAPLYEYDRCGMQSDDWTEYFSHRLNKHLQWRVER